MKIYISGKISGIENKAFEIFERAEEKLKLEGFDVVNPMKINHQHDNSWESYMKEDIKSLCDCDAIYMLNNWSDSKGAKIELDLAMSLGLDVKFQET